MAYLTKQSLCLMAGVLLLTACQSSQISIRPVTSWEMAGAGSAGSNFYSLGKSYLESSSVALAIDAFRQDLRQNGDSVHTLNGLGVAYDMLGRYDLSQKYYERALELSPSSSVTFSNLAYSQYKQGAYNNAVILADKAERLLARQETGVAKTFLTNLETAGSKKIEEEMQNDEAAPVRYRVQRVGERDWKVLQEKPARIAKSPVKYKSNIAIQQILDRAKDVSEPKVEKVIQQPKETVYSIVNGTGRARMAKRFAVFLGDRGVRVRSLRNASYYGHDVSVIKFSPGYEEEAKKMAETLPVAVRLIETSDLKAKVQLILGADLLAFDETLLNSRVS